MLRYSYCQLVNGLISQTIVYKCPYQTGDKPVTLPSTQAVLNQMTKNGLLLENIDNIQVGYEWTQETSNDQVIDLNPTYFIQYKGVWRSLSALLAQKEELTEGS
ncbi:two-component system activity regulator YycH [Latilactobacillus sakei]